MRYTISRRDVEVIGRVGATVGRPSHFQGKVVCESERKVFYALKCPNHCVENLP